MMMIFELPAETRLCLYSKGDASFMLCIIVVNQAFRIGQ